MKKETSSLGLTLLHKLLVTSLLLSACASDGELKETEIYTTAMPTSGAVAMLDGASCPIIPKCRYSEVDTKAPTHCVAIIADDAGSGSSSEEIHAWGENPCQAKENVLQNTCEEGYQPGELSDLKCVPDTSQGRCEQMLGDRAEHYCGDTDEEGAFVCRAHKYDDQLLSKSMAIVGEGESECEAKINVYSIACEKNLDPDSLGEVVCEEAGGGH